MASTEPGKLIVAAQQRLAIPGKILWLLLTLLLIDTGVAPAGQASLRTAELRNDTSDFDNPGLIHTFAPLSNPGTAHIEPSKGMFLIAGRDLLDPMFVHSVVLLIAVNDNGALGLVINRATKYKLVETIPALQGDAAADDLLYLGGPVSANMITGLMRSEEATGKLQHVFHNVYFSASLPVLKTTLEKLDHKQRLRVYVGHAGWAPGQLQGELRRGDWHLMAADAELVFNTEPEHIWPRLIRSVSGLWVQNRTRQSSMVSRLGRP